MKLLYQYCLILLLLTVIGNVNSQSFPYEFRKLSKGISSNQIYTIYQDSKGFIWFGTRNGLNRFDGINYKVFKKNISDSTSLSSSEIKHILELESGDFLLSTNGGGVNFFNRRKGVFNELNLGIGLSRNDINQTFQDTKGDFWVATDNDGLIKLDANFHFINQWNKETGLKGNIIKHIIDVNQDGTWVSIDDYGISLIDSKKIIYNFNTGNSDLPSNLITSVQKSNITNHYWIGFEEGGIALIELKNHSILLKKHFIEKPQSLFKLKKGKVLSVLEDKQNRVWVGVENAGLYVIDSENDTTYHFINDKKNPLSLGGNSVWSIFQDLSNSIWLGVFNQPVNVVHETYNKFQHIKNEPFNSNSLNNNSVNAFLEKENGELWIGTDGGGINIYNRTNASFSIINSETSEPWKLSSNAVLDMIDDIDGNVWVGTWAGGINIIAKDGITTYNKENSALSSNNIFSIDKSFDGSLWIAEWKAGIIKYDSKNKKFKKSEINVPNKLIYKIFEDSKKNLWIGTANGLYLINFENDKLNKNEIIEFKSSQNKKSISSDLIQDIFEDSQGNIWIATADGGINKYIPNSQSFQSFTVNEGLFSDATQGIEEDLLGNLWISTDKGISKFNLKENRFQNFTNRDGLQEGSFLRKSVYKSPNNELFFGGVNGFNFFHPSYLTTNTYVPPVQLTSFTIFNKQVEIGENSPLTHRIEFTNSVNLSYKDLIFSIGFAALNYIHSENNQYQYKLEGFSDNWIEIGNQQFVTFTGIDHGKYTLLIKGSNNDKLWNETPISLEIIITPPWWETIWAQILFGITSISIFLGIFFYRTYDLKQQKSNLEHQVQLRTEELQAKQQEILAQNEELQQSQEELQTQRDYIKVRNDELTLRNSEIKGSIKVAQRIQDAILPSKSKLNAILEDYFLIYKPKDIVSGDFYWVSEKTNSKWLIIADCTGHGVPGAFMTLLGKNILDNLINDNAIKSPSALLYQLDLELKETLYQDKNSIRMSIDLMVLKITKEEKINEVKLEFAGAKSDLHIYDAVKKDIFRYRGNRFTVGEFYTRKVEFTNNEIYIPKNSIIYTASDGLQDQNNKFRERLSRKKLQDILLKNANQPLESQKTNLEALLNKHMEDTTQRDDILLMGIKV